jgi:hypothetical protein
MMRCTDTERNLVIRQLRRARDEVVRAKLMMAAIADEEDDEAVEDLANMAAALAGRIDAIVKAERIDDEDEDALED